MLARDANALQTIVENIKTSASKGIGYAFPVDLTDFKAMKTTVEKIIEEVGAPDVLINNAGAGKWTTILETSPEEIIQNIQVPGISTYVITKLFLQSMMDKATKKSPVHIINITSPAGLGMYVPGTSGGYSVARCMVTHVTELLRIDLRNYEDRVKISLVAPGKVSTSYFDTNGKGEQEDRVPMLRWIPQLTPEDVAKRVSKIIANRQGVNAVFPIAIRTLMTAFKIFPTIMQFFLTHVFGWQPPKLKARTLLGSRAKVNSCRSFNVFR